MTSTHLQLLGPGTANRVNGIRTARQVSICGSPVCIVPHGTDYGQAKRFSVSIGCLDKGTCVDRDMDDRMINAASMIMKGAVSTAERWACRNAGTVSGDLGDTSQVGHIPTMLRNVTLGHQDCHHVVQYTLSNTKVGNFSLRE